MKILVLLPRVPYPLEKGDKLRAYNHIKYLAKNNEIILCALNDTEVHPEAIKNLQPFCKSIHIFNISKFSIGINLMRAFFKGIPFQTGYFFNKKAQKEIDRIIVDEKPDHIFCQLVRVAEYMKDKSIPKTIDYQDVFSKGIGRRMENAPFYSKPIFRSEYNRLLNYERDVFEMFDNKTIISIPDRDLIPHPEKEKIHIVINGVDTDFFKPMKRDKDYEIVFIGNMAYPPNVNAAEYLANKILPLVQKSKPNARLLLAGATPDKRVLALQSDSVTVTGWMDDIRDGYARAKIFIAPMQIGTGLQNKLLEAMAMKIPSVTSQLANNALSAKDGKEILVGNTPEDYAKLINKLLDNSDFADKIAEAGYQFVIDNYNWESATAVLEEVMKSNTVTLD
jgi:sugar transferase (PEP-CTERM/EpsH1 system associated)